MLKKPDYRLHRQKAVIDTSVLATLLTQLAGRGVNAKGFAAIHGFVKFVGGTAPTITLQPCEIVKWLDPAGVEQTKLVSRGAAIGPLSEDDAFEAPTPGGGLWILRISALTGAPTDAQIYVAGGAMEPEGSI